MSDLSHDGILQRDGKSYAIVTRTPSGIVTPEYLETVASVARKYNIPLIKLTSGQRFTLVGIPERDIPAIWNDLGSEMRAPRGPCVRYVQACLGTEFCKFGTQDSIGFAKEIEQLYRGKEFATKLKIGVSGCPRNCGESHIRDVGVLGSTVGWTVFFGGNSGTRPRIGNMIAKNLSRGAALDLIQRLLEYYQQNAKPRERTARFMERIGMDMLKSELLIMLPYIPLQDTTPRG